MKYLLLQPFEPRDPRTPIAIMDLASYGRKFGHFIDLGYPGKQSGDYDFVGLSSLIFCQEIFEILVGIRRWHSGRIVLGGKVTGTLQDEEIAEIESIGVEIFRGPGEREFIDQPIDYSTYPPWSAADFLLLDRTKKMWEIMSSRGCPYYCHFCHNTEPKVNHFSVDRTLANASLVLEVAKRDRVFFVDDVFALNAKYMLQLLKAADAENLELRKHNQFFVHISLISRERLEAIDLFEPIELQVGIESGDDGMLKMMGKTFSSAEAQDKLRLLHQHGHRVACLFLLGFPGETRQSLQATIDFVERNRQYMSGWWVSYYQPVPFTVGWEMVRERLGKIVTGGWNVKITYIDPNLTEDDLVSARQAIMLY